MRGRRESIASRVGFGLLNCVWLCKFSIKTIGLFYKYYNWDINLCNCFPWQIVWSRPRSVEEVAYQDEVVAVLKKCLQGADVSLLFLNGVCAQNMKYLSLQLPPPPQHPHTCTAAKPAFLRPSGHWQNIHHPSSCQTVVWVSAHV